MSAAEKSPNLQHVAQVQGLFVKHSSQVRGFIVSLLPGSADVDDVLQETFLTITAKAESFELGTNFTAWAMTIARFKVKELYRKSQKSELLLDDEILDTLLQEAPDELVESDAVLALRKCVSGLSPNVQKMLSQRYEDEMKPEKIARDAGWGANSVYVALSRARSSLRRCIEKQTSTALRA